MSERLKKVNDLLRDEVSKILLHELRVPDGILVTVTRASVSPTLEHATVWISVLPEDKFEIVIKKINGSIYGIQQSLNKRLVMRPVPKIRFAIDQTEKHAGHIEEILQKIAEK